MSSIVKRLMVVFLAAVMFLGMAITPVSAKRGGGNGKKPEPTQEQTDETQPGSQENTVIEDQKEEAEPQEVIEVAEEPAPDQNEITGDIPAEPQEAIEGAEEPSPDQNETAEDIPADVFDDAKTSEEQASDLNANAYDELDSDENTAVEDDEKANAVLRTLSLRATDDGNKIAASKSVTDEDGDGIYDLKLSVTGNSNKSQSEKLYKSNVVLVIDVSGSMDYSVSHTTYRYSKDTYDPDGSYRGRNNNNSSWNSPVYYDTERSQWYYTSWGTRTYLNANATIQTNYGTRLDATKSAARVLVRNLLANNSAEHPDIVEISIIKFARKYESGSGNNFNNGTMVLTPSKSTNETQLITAINGLREGGGTNWQAALELAKTEIDDFPISTDSNVEETNYVIMLTDGVPTRYGEDQGNGQEQTDNINASFAPALDPAKNLVNTPEDEGTDCTFYSIFAYGSGTNINYLRRLTNYAYGGSSTDTSDSEYCFDAQDTAALQEAFSKISDKISSNVGFGGVAISDGLSVGSTNSTIAVDGTVHPEYFVYTVYDESKALLYTVTFDTNGNATFKDKFGDSITPVTTESVSTELPTGDGGTRTVTNVVYSVPYGTGAGATTYMMTPATVGKDGMIEWDLSGLGILEKWTYELSFKVWPNQAAYDIAADLNNGLYNGDLVTAINDYVAKNKITQTEGDRLKTTMRKDDETGKYVVSTNYSQDITYHEASIEQIGDQEPVTVYEDPQKDLIVPIPNPIPLTGSLIPMEKRWGADLAITELQELVFGKNETYTGYKVVLHLKRDGTDYMTYTFPKLSTDEPHVPVDKDGNVSTDVTKLVWSQDAAIAPGRLVSKDPGGGTHRTVTLTGEKATAAGVAGTYYIINDGHEYKIIEDEESSDLHFEFEADDYHPMIVDGQLMNIKFNSVGTDGKIADESTAEVVDPEMVSVFATNTLKGGLNIRKVVTGEDRTTEVADCTDEFTFEVTLTEKGQAFATPADQYSYTEPANPDEWSKDTTDPENPFWYKSGFAAYSVYNRGTDGKLARIERGPIPEGGKVTLTMPANGEIRIGNLPTDVEYTVKEIVGTSNEYSYFKTVSRVKLGEDEQGNDIYEGEPVETTNNEVSGQIVGNKAKVEIYYNWASSFYVYHSSDNTVEKISFADERVTGTYDAENGYTYTFNIFEETKAGTLYGGYYTNYKNKSTGFDVTKLNFTADGNKKYWATDEGEGAKPYDAKTASVWKKAEAYTDVKKEDTGGGIGTEMTPVADVVYYLKEVPNGYIRPYIHFTYDDYDPEKPLKKLFLITASDDTNYDSVGYMIDDDEEMTGVAKGALSISMKKPNGTIDAVLTVKSIWKDKPYHGETVNLTRGYLYSTDYSKAIGTGVTFRPCWTTLDKVLVKGVTVRTVNTGTSKNDIGVTDSAADSE